MSELDDKIIMGLKAMGFLKNEEKSKKDTIMELRINKPEDGYIAANVQKRTKAFWSDKDQDFYKARSDIVEMQWVDDMFNGLDPIKKADKPALKEQPKEAPEALIPARSQAPTEPGQSTAMTVASASQSNALINHNKTDAVVINNIAIPNEYIVLYKQGNKLVPFIREKGLVFLAGKMGIWSDPRANDPTFPADKLIPAIDHEVIKYPWVENEFGPKGVCIVKGIVRMSNGQVFTEEGTTTPENMNAMQKKYPLENAITRAKARALRDATHCNVCSLEEADIDPKNIIDAEFTVVSQGGQ